MTYEDKIKKQKSELGSHSPKTFSCKKCENSEESSNDYKVDRRNRRCLGLEILRPLNKLLHQSHEFWHTASHASTKAVQRQWSGKISIRDTRMDVQMKPFLFKPSASISVF